MSLQQLVIANIIRYVEQLHGFEVIEESAQHRDVGTDAGANPTIIEDQLLSTGGDELLAMNGDPPPQQPTKYSAATQKHAIEKLHRILLKKSDDEKFAASIASATATKDENDRREQGLALSNDAALDCSALVEKLAALGVPGVGPSMDASAYLNKRRANFDLDLADETRRATADVLFDALNAPTGSGMLEVIAAAAKYLQQGAKPTARTIAEFNKWTFEATEPANQRKLTADKALSFGLDAFALPEAKKGASEEIVADAPTATHRAKAITAVGRYFIKMASHDNAFAFSVYLVTLAEFLHTSAISPLHAEVIQLVSTDDEFFSELEIHIRELVEATTKEEELKNHTFAAATHTLTVKSEVSDEKKKRNDWQVPVLLGRGYNSATFTAKSTTKPVKLTTTNAKLSKADVDAISAAKTLTFANNNSNVDKAIMKLIQTLDVSNDSKTVDFTFDNTAASSALVILRGQGDCEIEIAAKATVKTGGWSSLLATTGSMALLSLIQVRLGDVKSEETADAAPTTEDDDNADEKKSTEAESSTKTPEQSESAKPQVVQLLRQGLIAENEDQEGTDAFKMLTSHADSETMATRMFTMSRIQESAKPSARAVFAVMLCHLPAQVAIQELQQRWNLDWAQRLQGEPNKAVRKYLVQLCEFIVKRVRAVPVPSDFSNGYGPTRKSNLVLQGLMTLLLAHYPLKAIEAELVSRRTQALRVTPALQALERLICVRNGTSPAGRGAIAVLASWLHKEGIHYGESLQGCGAQLEDEIRTSLFSLIFKAKSFAEVGLSEHFGPASTTHSLLNAGNDATDRAFSLYNLLRHPFSASDLAALVDSEEPAAASLRKSLLEVLTAMAKHSPKNEAVSVSENMYNIIPNEFFTTKPGVHALVTPRGVQVDRTGMDVCALRGTSAWPTKVMQGFPATMYFEVKFLSKNVKRCMVGVCTPQANVEEFDTKKTTGMYFLDSGSNKTSLVSFGDKGDVVGCGFDILGEFGPTVFFTVNGTVVLRQQYFIDKKKKDDEDEPEEPFLFPFITYETTDKSSIMVNFGSGAFMYPHTEQNVTYHSQTHRCMEDTGYAALRGWMSLVSRSVAVGSNATLDRMLDSTLSLLEAIPAGAATISAEKLGNGFLASIVELVQSTRLNAARAKKVADAMVKFSTKCCTEVKPTVFSIIETCLSKYPHRLSAESLIGLLSELKKLNAKDVKDATIPFVPRWTQVNDELSYANAQVVKVTKEHKFTHAIGTALPNEGTTTFSVQISHTQPEVDSIMMLGHFYIGVTTTSVGVLGSGSWKTASPPNVWALHSRLHSQLSHADEAVLGNDPYLFTNGSVVTVIVDREMGTVSFKRGTKVYENVFVGVPPDAELRPFVQVVGEFAWGTILPGERTASLTNTKLAYGASISLMRMMLTIPNSSTAIAESVNDELSKSSDSSVTSGATSVPWRSLAVIGAASDPRIALFRHSRGTSTVNVKGIDGTIATVCGEDQLPLMVDVADLHTPTMLAPFAPLQLSEEDDTFIPEDDESDEDDLLPRRTADGIRSCAEGVSRYVAQWGVVSVGRSLLIKNEAELRVELEKQEAEAFGAIVAPHKAHQFEQLHNRNSTLMSGVLQGLAIPQTYTFNRRDTSDGMSIPSHYDGKLALSTMDSSGKVHLPLVGIANEAIPKTGITNIRAKFCVDWMGLLPTLPHQVRPLPRGFYFGVCLGSYHGAKRQHSLVSPPDMWAITSMDDPEHHLKHSCESMKRLWFMFDQDTIRLQIDRKEGTVTAYRSPAGGREINLGKVFDNLPADVDLFPFVQIPIARASAMFLPENAALPRREHNDVRFAHMVNRKDHFCDGCLAQLVQTELSAPNWYRCNHCDYDLCRQCFVNHVHPGHTFTHMRPTSFIATPIATNKDINRNASVEISTVPVHLLDAHNVSLKERHFNCEATTTSTGASAIWGLLRRASASSAYECAVKFTKATNCASNSAVASGKFNCIFGIGNADAITGKTRADVLDAARKGTGDVLLIASNESEDVSAGFKLVTSRQQASGFDLDDTLSFILHNNNLALSKNGSCIRSMEVKWTNVKLCVFVFIEEKDVTVSLLPPSNEFVTGKIGEISKAHKLVRVTAGTANRWCAQSDAHTPISVAKAHNVLEPGMMVYVARPTLSQFVRCTVISVGAADEPITVSDGETKFLANIESIFVANHENSAKSVDETSLFPEVKARMKKFYAKYAPEKSEADMDKAIQLYARAKGGHDAMFEALIKKYGPEPVQEVAIAPKENALEDIGGISFAEAFTVSRLLSFILSMLRGRPVAAEIGQSAVPVLAKTISLLSTIKIPVDTSAADPIPLLMAETGMSYRKTSASLHFPAQNISSEVSGLEKGATAVVIQGEHLGKLVTVESIDATTAECVLAASGEKLVVSSTWLAPSQAAGSTVAEKAPWFTAADDSVLGLPAMETYNWDGVMHCKNGFSFSMKADLRGKSAVLGTRSTRDTLKCTVEDVTITRSERAISFVLTEGDNDEMLKMLEESTVSLVASSRRRQCPKANSKKPVTAAFSGVFRNDGTISGSWVLPNGNSGSGSLWEDSKNRDIDGNTTCALIPDITTVPADVTDSSDPLKVLIVRLALRVHVAAVSKICLPSVAEFVGELLNTRDPALQAALLRHAASTDPSFFSGVVARLMAICHDPKTSKMEAITAASVLPLLLETSCVGVDCATGPVFWELFRASLAVGHRFVNSLSALSGIIPFVSRQPAAPLTSTLVMPLFGHFNRQILDGLDNVKSLSLAASVLSLVFATASNKMQESRLPLKTLAFLTDFINAVNNGAAVPAAADSALDTSSAATGAVPEALKWEPLTKNAEVHGNVINKGCVMANIPIGEKCGPVYFEAVHPANSRIVIGVANAEFKNHCIATEAFGHHPMIGYNANTFGYDGTQTLHDYNVDVYGWAKVKAKDVVGCWVDAKTRTIRFSVNGELYNETKLPNALKVDTLYPVVQVNTNDGIKIMSRDSELRHLPHECSPLEQQVVTVAGDYDPVKRSTVAPASADKKAGADFYSAVATYMDNTKNGIPKKGPLAGETEESLKPFIKHIEIIEAAVNACKDVIDLEAEGGKMLELFAVAKRLMRKSFRKEHLINIPSVEKKDNPRTLSQVTVRWYNLFSKQERTPELALHNSILGQLYRQMGNDNKMFEHTPMFMTALMMTDSGHIPIDAGGPYNQVWSLISEEMMTGNDKPNFHRNPLFKYVENANGKRVVPDAKRNSVVDLALFRFMGKIMGHMVRVKNPLAFEIAPFVWKYLVEDPLVVEDLYDGLESYWRDSVVENEELLDSDQVTEYFPDFHEVYTQMTASPTHMQRLGEIALRKKAAEHCLIHSLDAQLSALRAGLWSTLGKKTVRALTNEDIEFLVCGDPNPSFEQVQESISCTLPSPQKEFFWQVMKELTPKEWSDFFYFASARKRYPLAQKISVHPSNQSENHMPVASTCFSQITMPLYRSADKMKEKLKQAIACKDMELA